MQKLQVINLVAGSLLGGYVFTWGLTALGIVGLVALGADFHEAETGMLLVAFVVFLVAFLWSFAAASMLRVWATLAGGGIIMVALTWWIQTMLLGGA